jgi:hypothetical protein
MEILNVCKKRILKIMRLNITNICSNIFLLPATFNTEESVAAFTIKTIDDPRTLNKILYIRPEANTLSYNDLISLWEKETCKTLKRVYIPEEQVLKMIQG